MNRILLSKQKFDEMMSEYRKLKKDLIDTNEREQTDLLESLRDAAAYEVSLSQQMKRINELKTILDKARILPESINSNRVVLGSRFEALGEEGKIIKGRLVHPLEADPAKGLYSVESPFGKELQGKRVKDTVKFGDKSFVVNKLY